MTTPDLFLIVSGPLGSRLDDFGLVVVAAASVVVDRRAVVVVVFGLDVAVVDGARVVLVGAVVVVVTIVVGTVGSTSTGWPMTPAKRGSLSTLGSVVVERRSSVVGTDSVVLVTYSIEARAVSECSFGPMVPR